MMHAIFEALFSVLLNFLTRPRIRSLVSLAITGMFSACFLLATQFTVFAVREGSIEKGYLSVFPPSQTTLRERLAFEQAQMLQSAQSHDKNQSIIADLLAKHDGVSRIRLAKIHNGIFDLNNQSMWRFDVIALVAAPGRDTGGEAINQPMTGWSRFVGKLANGECVVYAVEESRDSVGYDHLRRMGAKVILICPLLDEGRLIGTIFVMWDSVADAPTGDKLETLKKDTQDAGREIVVSMSFGKAVLTR